MKPEILRILRYDSWETNSVFIIDLNATTVQLSRFRTKTRSNECFTRSLLGVKLGRLLDGYSVDRAIPRSLRDYVME